MKIASMVTQKGGSGKSTLARHLAVAAHLSGLKAVVMDCDMQGSLRDWSETRQAPDGGDRQEPAVLVELSPNAKHIQAQIERQREAGVEFLVLDTPGGLQTPVPFIAAGLSDLVLVPIRPTGDDLNAFWPLAPRLKATGRSVSVVLSACPTTTTRPRLEAEAVLQADGVDVCPVAIHTKEIVPASGVVGLTVLEMPPTTDAERRTVKEFQDLYAWVSDKLNLRSN